MDEQSRVEQAKANEALTSKNEDLSTSQDSDGDGLTNSRRIARF